MATEDYEVRLSAVDNDFTKSLNRAVDLLGRVEAKTPGAEKAIDRLDRVLAKTAASGNNSVSRFEAISKALRDVEKAGGVAGKELGKVVTAVQAAFNQSGNPAIKKGLDETAKAAEKAAQEVRELQALYNNDPGFKNDAAGRANASNTVAFTDRNRGNADDLRGAIVARANQEVAARKMLVQVEKDHSAAIRENMRFDQERAYASYSQNIAATKMREQFESGLSNQRYLLYDVAATWGMVSAATLGASVAAVKVAASYEYAAAAVQRTSQTSGKAFDNLYRDLVDLSTQMPESFDNIAGIATLGGQLGVAAQDIEKFTSTVTMFAATTDVSAQAAAEGLGRVAQLTGTTADEYENLSSAIYEVGVNSVATESAILSTATQISTAADLAGFANYEIVALAGAFASLGIAPERSRGTIQRVFGQITASVSDGGAMLEKFAKVSDMSASEFAAAWQNAPQTAFNAFISGMGKMQDAGEDTNAMLKDLKIGAVRDIQALQALSNNMAVYTQAQEDSNRAYRDGTSTIDAYGVVADTLQAKFMKLANTFKALLAEMGNNDGLKVVVDLLQQIGEGFLAFTRHPAGEAITTVTLALAAGVGLFAAYRAAIALTQASLIGMVQAQLYLSTETAKNNLQGRNLIATLLRVGVGFRTAKTATDQHTASMAANTGATSANAAAQGRWATASKVGAGAARAGSGALGLLGTAAKGLARAFGPVALLWGAFEAGTAIWDSLKSTSTRIDEFSSSMTGMVEAMRADTKIYEETGKAIRTIDVDVNDNKKSLEGWEVSLSAITTSQDGAGDAADDAAGKVRGLTVAIGENTKAAIANSIATDEEFRERWEELAGSLENTDFDLSKFVGAVVQGSDTTVEYIQKVRNEFLAASEVELASLQKTADDTQAALAQARLDEGLAPIDQKNEAAKRLNEAQVASDNASAALARYKQQVDDTKTAIDGMSKQGEIVVGSIEKQANMADFTRTIFEGAGVAFDDTAESMGGVGDSANGAAEGLKNLVETAYAAISATAGMNSSLISLGESLVDNGLDFTVDTSEGISNLNALQSTVQAMAEASGDDYYAFAERVGGLIVQLQGLGADLTGDAMFLGDVMSSVLGEQYGVHVDSEAAVQSIFTVIEAAIVARQELLALANQALPATNFSGAGEYAAQINAAKAQAEQAQRELEQLERLKSSLQDAAKNSDNVTRSYNDRTRATDNNTKSQKKNTKAAKEAAEEFRTLSDYANEVASVLNRAYTLKFSVQLTKDDLEDAWDALEERFTYDPIKLEFDFGGSFSEKMGLSNARDAVTSQFYEMQDSAKAAAKAVRDAQQAIKDANANLGSLETERAKLLRQIAVSEQYGDTARVAEGKAKLAELDADISRAKNEKKDAEEALRQAQSDASRSTTGNSAAAIRNRRDLQDLAGAQLDYIDLLVQSGASESKVAQAVKEASKEFEDQATALGFSSASISTYTARFATLGSAYTNAAERVRRQNKAIEDNSTKLKGNSEAARENRAAFDAVMVGIMNTAQAMLDSGVPAAEVQAWLDGQIARLKTEAEKWGISDEAVQDYITTLEGFKTIIGKIPANVTTSVTMKSNESATDQALKEFWAKKKYEAKVKAKTTTDKDSGKAADTLIAKYRSKGINIKAKITTDDAGLRKAARGVKLFSEIQALLTELSSSHYMQYPERGAALRKKVDEKTKKLSSGNYWSGGFTGRGGKHEEAGTVHRGEYVIPQEGVNQSTGLPKPEYLGSLFVPGQSMSQPSGSPGGSSGPRVQIVELLPGQLRELAAMVSTEVNIDGKKLTRVVNSNNRNASIRGVN